MKGLNFIRRLTGAKMTKATRRYLDNLGIAGQQQYQTRIEDAFKEIQRPSGSLIHVGTTPWRKDIKVPIRNLYSHSLCIGASGTGKSFSAVNFLMSTISHKGMGSGVFDAKGEIFDLAVRYLYAYLLQLPQEEQDSFHKRVYVIDFSNAESICPYNILHVAPGEDIEFLVERRLDAISELFSDYDASISLRMRSMMRYLFLLAGHNRLPLPLAARLLDDPQICLRLALSCPDERVRHYFCHNFEKEMAATLLAVRQRIDTLLAAESVRLSLSSNRSPDFSFLQDNAAIVLVNTAGRNISPSVSRLLQTLILQDIKQSIFSRKKNQTPFIWFMDEAQEFYRYRSAQTALEQILTMGRSFGSFVCLLTQAITSAVHDPDVLNTLMANIGWLLMFRSTIRDARLIESALPLTGRVLKNRGNPYKQPELMRLEEERQYRLASITSLHNRTGYFWLKTIMPEAVPIQTPSVPQPHELAGCSEERLQIFTEQIQLGSRIKKADVVAEIRKRGQELFGSLDTKKTVPSERLLHSLEEEYKRKIWGNKD